MEKATVKQSGLLNNLKVQLRNRLVADLQANLAAGPGPGGGRGRSRPARDLLQQVADSLVADHLRNSGYEYTRSVFIPESGVPARSLFAAADVLAALNVTHGGALFRGLVGDRVTPTAPGDARGNLVTLLGLLGQHEAEQAQRFAATAALDPSGDREANPEPGLGSKLAQLDSEFDARAASLAAARAGGTESRIERIERECEARYEAKLESELTRIRETELVKARLEERDRYQLQLARATAEHERVVEARLADIARKEEDADARIIRKEAEAEAARHALRQQILEKMDRASSLEAELKREAALNSRTNRMQTEALRSTEQQLEMRESALDGLREHYARETLTQVAAAKAEMLEQNAETAARLAAREQQLGEELAMVRQQQLIHERLSEDVVVGQREVARARAEMADISNKLGAQTAKAEMLQAKLDGMRDYDAVLRQAELMRQDLARLGTELAEHRDARETLGCELNSAKVKIETMARQLTQPSPELVELRELCAAHDAERTVLVEQRTLADERTSDLQATNEHIKVQLRETQGQVRSMRLCPTTAYAHRILFLLPLYRGNAGVASSCSIRAPAHVHHALRTTHHVGCIARSASLTTSLGTALR